MTRIRIDPHTLVEFRLVWRGQYYEQKKVQVIYVEEQEVAITVTVYVFGSYPKSVKAGRASEVLSLQ